MEKIIIRSATPADVELLQTIGRQTFSETFAAVNTAENMKKYLDEKFSSGVLLSELNDKNSNFYFALAGEEIVGYLKLNFGQSQTELRENRAVEIERIYVSKEFHGKR